MRSLQFIAVSLMICASCVERYDPEINTDATNALVVDGHIDSSEEAIVLLSRSIPIYRFADTPKETGATVSINSLNGESFDLAESDPGTYKATSLPVSYDATYILRIRTSGEREYESDTVKIYRTPVVDRIYFAVSATSDELEFRSDSRDTDPNATGYYAFECTETYEYRASAFSRYKRESGGIPILRHKGEFVDTCWIELPVPLTLATTKNLTTNIISGHKLTGINKTSIKIQRRYSILVRQRSISKQEYTYRVQLAKTNEQQGNIFAEIPGSVLGNVHRVDDPHEVVLGYFRGQEIKERRLFVGRDAIPKEVQADPPVETCDMEYTCPVGAPVEGPNQCVDVEQLSDSKIIITAIEEQNYVVYVFASYECGDCTKKGGKTKPPDYWY